MKNVCLVFCIVIIGLNAQKLYSDEYGGGYAYSRETRTAWFGGYYWNSLELKYSPVGHSNLDMYNDVVVPYSVDPWFYEESLEDVLDDYGDHFYVVVSIGDGAFNGYGMSSITIPSSITSIDQRAFSGCNSLMKFVVNDNNSGGYVSINGLLLSDGGSCLYVGVNGAVVIPDCVLSIADGAFMGRLGLGSVTIPDSVTDIGASTFAGCTSLTNVVIGNGVKYIGYEAFSGCNSLKNITIPDNVTSIEAHAFSEASSLTNVVIGSGVKYIGSGAFSGCNSLKNITIPKSVSDIGASAFSECSSLESITIPDNVTTIEYGAFAGCTSLTNIIIGSGVADIGDNAFFRCSSLKEIRVDSSNPSYMSYNGMLLSKDGTTLIQGINVENIIIPEGVASIGEGAFFGCSKLRSVVIPDSVTSIGSSAFYGCSGFTGTLTIPDSVTSIGSSAFSGCSGLTSVTMPDSVTSIGAYAFYGCSGLTNVSIPSNVTNIGDYAFYGCTSIKDMVIPDAVTGLGYSVFEGCAALENVIVGDGVPNIKSSSFYGCRSLKNVTIGNGVRSIGDDAFFDCGSLQSITYGRNVSEVGIPALTSSSSLKVINFLGAPPGDFSSAGLPKDLIRYSSAYAEEWRKALSGYQFYGFAQPNRPIVEYVSIKVRESDPTILDCVYRVHSGKPTVKVRALAFKDGVRSFVNVVRPETFIEGTAANVGDAVAANVEHKLSWRVSEDWGVDLAKVTFEILATEDSLLPLELRTIPANGTNKAMEFSWNAITGSQVFTALLWLYADKDTGLVLVDGALFESSTRKMLAFDRSCSGGYISNPPIGVKNYLGTSSTVLSYSGTDSIRVIFSKIGFSLLSGNNLTYVNTMSRLGLAPSGMLQYAYRWIAD